MTSRPSRKSQTWLARGAVKAVSPAWRGRSEAESLDRAEASRTIRVVMVGIGIDVIPLVYASWESQERCEASWRRAQGRRAANCGEARRRWRARVATDVAARDRESQRARRRGRQERVPRRRASRVRETSESGPRAQQTAATRAGGALPATVRYRAVVLPEERLRVVDRPRTGRNGSRARQHLHESARERRSRVVRCGGPGPPASYG